MSPALLCVAHGTRDRSGTAVVESLVEQVQDRLAGVRVGVAYVDNASPAVPHAVARLAADGVDTLVVLPLLLTPAAHSKTDIAAAVQEARATHRGLTVRYGRPLGPHPALLAAAVDRLAAAGVGEDDPDVTVVLAAAGSADPDANAEVARAARLLWEGRGWAGVEVAFASTARPSVPDVLDRARRLGAPRVVVLPYFLAPGFLPDRVRRQAGDAPVTEVLGDHPAVAGLVAERYAEALGGDIRMSCDVCRYRTPFRGREADVGAPQRPHDHPDLR